MKATQLTVIAASFIGISAPAMATQLTVVNQTGHEICLAANILKHDDQQNLDYRQVAGWTCVATGQTSESLTFSDHAYIVAIQDGTTNYVQSHALGFATDSTIVGPSVNQGFELDFYFTANSVHWSYEFGGTQFTPSQVTTANGSETVSQVWWSQLQSKGFTTDATCWDFDAGQLGDTYSLTLTP